MQRKDALQASDVGPVPTSIHDAPTAKGYCSTDTECPTCGIEMQPEHAHYRCTRCGYRDSCCM